MKALDKIYISPNIENRTWLIGKADTTNIEYIRKDALMEWTNKENLKFNRIGNEQDHAFARGMTTGLGYLISKLSRL